MTLVFNALPGDPAANSYCDEATASAYFDGRLGAAVWDTTEQLERQKALVTATARLEQEYWVGQQGSVTQRLRWPRAWVLPADPFVGSPLDPYFRTGYYDSTTVPRPIQEACAELALYLLQEQGADTTEDPLAPTGLAGLSSLGISGSLSVTPVRGAPADHLLPPHVARMLRGFLAAPQTRLVRS